ncbi:glutathione S-transferase [Erythrobacter sp. 3-20A1M]|uniref:glutathione S-transferase family protein n=1 Tax=Erythrobacter sp. 3-20A1M TaxID=2653850 RepID=UPI001BFC2276|nr:glutathione binding-like protein [Erythrobacter sp. 3-20A1M]QWC57894.1 glutathione S-transferase [Erythrobacter sp. 3-20A1M]
MPVLYHSPQSRSDTVVDLVRLLKADVEIREVAIVRQDGSGGPDPENPHPEKKVPFLVDGAEQVRERGAIMLYLTDAYPQQKLGPLAGEPGRGAYLSWLSYYQGVMEPLIVMRWAGLSHPAIEATFRDEATMLERLAEPLREGPYLLGERFSAADLLCASPFRWFSDLLPDEPLIREWVERCAKESAQG